MNMLMRCCRAWCAQEVAGWEALVAEAEAYGGEAGDAAALAAEAGSPDSDAAEPADIAELRQVHADLHRHLTMQASAAGVAGLEGG